jgi:hypothetical protein
MTYVKNFESFIQDMEFPKDCEHCGDKIMNANEESSTYPGMCLWCDSNEDDTVDIVCTNCNYQGPMDINANVCPECLTSECITAITPGSSSLSSIM